METNEVRIDRNLLRWIVLALGLIGLVVMAVALIATPGNRFDTVSYAALAVAILGIGGFVLLDPQAVVEAVTGRTGVYTITSWAMTLFFIAVIVGLFLVIKEANIDPLDLTKSGEYKLHEETITLLEGLQSPVHVYAFYSGQASSQQEEAEIWLQKYENTSNGMLTYEVVDIDRNPALANRYEVDRSGVIVFEQGENTAEATFANENNLTTALSQVLLGEKRVAYLITGHGERGMDDFTGGGYSDALNALERANFDVQPLDLFTSESIPDDADLLIIAGPQAQYGTIEIEKLNTYLDVGGKLLVMLDPGTAGGALGSGVQGVAYSSSGGRLATAGADGTAKIWDARNPDEAIFTLRGHAGDVTDVSFNPTKQEVATLARDGLVRVWNATNGEQLQTLEGATVDTIRLTYTVDGKYLVAVGLSGAVNIWDATTFEAQEPIATTTQLVAVEAAPEGSTFAAAGVRSTASGGIESFIYVWDAATGEKLVERSLHTDAILDLAYAPDGQTIYSVAADGTLGTLELDDPDGATTTTEFGDEGLSAFAVAPDGTQIFALLSDYSIHVRKPDADEDLVLEGHTDRIWKIVASPDGQQIASASKDGNVRIWNLEDGSTDFTLSAHRGGDELTAYLANTWGIAVKDDIVIFPFGQAYGFDAGTVVIGGRDGFAAQSPITQPLQSEPSGAFFVLTRSIELTELDTLTIQTVEILIATGDEPPNGPWSETGTLSSTNPPEYDEGEDTANPITIGASAENSVTGGRVVVIGDSDFASNNGLGSTNYANEKLLLNTANWLTEGDILSIPAPDFDVPRFEEPFSPAGLIVAAIASVCILPLVSLVTGAVVWFVRRRRR